MKFTFNYAQSLLFSTTMSIHRILVVAVLLFCTNYASAAYNNDAEALYLSNWELLKQSYTVPLPADLKNACANKGPVTFTAADNVEITPATGASLTSDQLQARCGASQQCIISEGVTVRMTGNLNVGAVINKVRSCFFPLCR
jgi:hypothetical protein